MNTIITNLNCRICLIKCESHDLDVEKAADDYQTLTGLKINDTDIPRKICNSCESKLMHLKEFIKVCKETEKFLIKLNENPESESEHEYKEEIITDLIEVESVKPKRSRNSEKVICEICAKEVTRGSLLKHKQLCHSENVIKFQCDLCKLWFTNKGHLKRHMSGVHLNFRPYSCEYCGKKFTYTFPLKYHINVVHLKAITRKCETCGKTFGSKEQLRNHSYSHLQVPNVPCPDCDRMFRSMHHLRKHQKIVHVDEKLPCQYCSKTFKNKKHLKQHEKSHLPNAYQCPVCPNTFASAVSLRGHVERSHPEYKMPPVGTILKNVDINELNKK
uniref:CSON007064 protein n=1 Tax=Culicoides sonorensis TaxID=179676 RepID=A0A336M175_CULSO